MTQPAAVLICIPPGLGEMAAHHEATAGMGNLTPGPRPFLYPPQTVATCAAVARAAGLTVRVLDAAAGALGGETGAAALQGALDGVAAAQADVLAVLVSPGTLPADENFLRALRLTPAGRVRRLLFGPSARGVAGGLLAEGLADAALLGEPEGAFAEAVAQLAAGDVAGLIEASTLRPDRYGPPGRLRDLDALPFPAWDLAPWQPYGAASLLSSRGCPAGCAWCAYTVAGGPAFRAQSAERTVAELAWLADEVRPPRLQVRDPVFAHDRQRAAAIAEGLIRRGIRLDFACESRPEHFSDDLLALLARAGCTAVKIGLESGDAALLVRLGRAADGAAAARSLAETQRVARTCLRLGIRCQVFVLAGLPGQDAASLARTTVFLRRLPAETAVRAKPYQWHPGAALTEPAAAVAAETLAVLESANRPAPGLWQRGWAAMRGNVPQPAGLRVSRSGRQSSGLPYITNSLTGTRVFLTGGSGFVGGHVARALVATGAQVVALVRPDSSTGVLTDLPVEIVRGDLRQPSAWRTALTGCTLCCHVAALYAGADQTAALYAANVSAVSALLAACAGAGVRRVIYTGTVGTVGRPVAEAALPDEETPFTAWDASSHYVKSKWLGELVARSWAGVGGLQVVIVKPTAPVGAGDARPSATGRRILAALRGEVTPYPPGGVNHVPVADVAAGHVLAAEHGASGRTYILGHRAGNLDQAAFLRLVAEASGTPPLRPPRARPAASALPAALTANPARAIAELGLPQSDLRGAFAEAVRWFGKHKQR